MIFNSKLFMKYFVRYFLREVRDIDEQFLFRMLDYFRNEVETRQTPWDPATAPESETRESLQQGEEFIDPLTGRPVRVITSYYVSNEEQSPGASQGRSGDHGRPRRNRILNGPLGDRDILDLIDRDDEQSDEERDPCDADLAEIILGLIGDGQLDLDGRPIIGFLEYFIKEQLADLIPDLDKTFENYDRYESDTMFDLLVDELEYIREVNVPRPVTSNQLDPSFGAYYNRFFRDLGYDDAALRALRGELPEEAGILIVEEIQDYLSTLPERDRARPFYEDLRDLLYSDDRRDRERGIRR